MHQGQDKEAPEASINQFVSNRRTDTKDRWKKKSSNYDRCGVVWMFKHQFPALTLCRILLNDTKLNCKTMNSPEALLMNLFITGAAKHNNKKHYIQSSSTAISGKMCAFIFNLQQDFDQASEFK